MLYGAAGTGKSTLSLALMREIHPEGRIERVNTRDDLRKLPGAAGVVYDDVDPEQFTREEMIKLVEVEEPATIKARYNDAEKLPLTTI